MPRETVTDHKWIAEVLSDIEMYAAANNLGRLQLMIADARRIANEEASACSNASNYDAVMAVVYREMDMRNR